MDKVVDKTIRIKPSKPQFEILISDKQINAFIAGQGSGKTHCAGLVTGMLISDFPGLHGFIGANTYPQLSDSTLFRIRKVWKDIFGWSEFTKSNPKGNYVSDIIPPEHFNTSDHEYESYHGKICFESGTVIYKGSLDNYKAHDGKEFAWAILDETKDTKEEAVKEVILGRLREQGMVKNNMPWQPLFIFTSPAKAQWLNEWFNLDNFASEIKENIYSDVSYFSKDIDNKKVVISSALHNSANLPVNFIENQKKNLHSALQDMLIYGNPFSRAGGEFYKFFDRSKHVISLKRPSSPLSTPSTMYDPSLPLHISFDFNVNPYITCTIWQITYENNAKEATQIDEICLSNPYNTTAALCSEFKRRFAGHIAGLFIYGDPAGEHEDTRVQKRTEERYNDYLIIRSVLKDFRPTMRVSHVAPPVKLRGDFLNTILEKNFAGISIRIAANCSKTITDYLYGKEAPDGRKLKETETNDQTGITSQKYHHITDANDYLLCTVFAKEFTLYQTGGNVSEFRTGRKLSRYRF